MQGSLIGTAVGLVPGGHAVANLLSYSMARRTSRHPERFGHGEPRGVIAAEAGNGSSEGGSMAMLLALGLPTGGATAIMLVAFDMHNITGGPEFMRDHKDLVYAVILSNLAQVGFLVLVGLGFVFAAGWIIKVPLRILVGSVLSLAILGAYVLTGNMVGPIALFFFAILGWIMQRLDYPVSAIAVGLLLARLTEGSLLRTYQMSGGDPSFLLHRPIALTLLVMLICSAALPLLRIRRSRAIAAVVAKKD